MSYRNRAERMTAMDFVKISPDSERLLDKIVSATNPTQFLSDSFDNVTSEEDDELRNNDGKFVSRGDGGRASAPSCRGFDAAVR